MRVSQNGVNSLLVTWTPSEGPDVTGYTVHYQQIDRESGSVMAKNTDTNVTITGLIAAATFSISVSANSNTLPSSMVSGPDVTIIHEEGMCDNIQLLATEQWWVMENVYGLLSFCVHYVFLVKCENLSVSKCSVFVKLLSQFKILKEQHLRPPSHSPGVELISYLATT